MPGLLRYLNRCCGYGQQRRHPTLAIPQIARALNLVAFEKISTWIIQASWPPVRFELKKGAHLINLISMAAHIAGVWVKITLELKVPRWIHCWIHCCLCQLKSYLGTYAEPLNLILFTQVSCKTSKVNMKVLFQSTGASIPRQTQTLTRYIKHARLAHLRKQHSKMCLFITPLPHSSDIPRDNAYNVIVDQLSKLEVVRVSQGLLLRVVSTLVQ